MSRAPLIAPRLSAGLLDRLLLLRLSQFWLQALYGLVILIAVTIDAALLRRFQRSATGRRRS
jgi:predicted ABC-type sugar transport system permease subunit